MWPASPAALTQLFTVPLPGEVPGRQKWVGRPSRVGPQKPATQKEGRLAIKNWGPWVCVQQESKWVREKEQEGALGGSWQVSQGSAGALSSYRTLLIRIVCVTSPAPNGTTGPVQVAIKSRPPGISIQHFTYQVSAYPRVA